MNNKVFVYNELLLNNVLNTLKLVPIDESLAITEGKMYYVLRSPILLKLNDFSHNRGNRKIFGSLMTFDKKRIENSLYILDNFHGCSLSRTGINHPLDLTYRELSIVYPIVVDNVHQLENYDYKVLDPIKCWVYYGNTQNQNIIKAYKNKHNKLIQGIYVKGFKDLLKRKNLITKEG